MASFKDNLDREWLLSIDAPKILRVREECDPRFMLEDSRSESTYERLENDPATLCRVIYVLCEKQRIERAISEESFYGSVIGSAIDSATEALLKSIVSFSPRRQREMLEAAAGIRGRIQQKGIDAVLAKISDPALEEAIVSQMNEAIDAAIAKVLSTAPSSAASAPASSVSHQKG